MVTGILLYLLLGVLVSEVFRLTDFHKKKVNG
jgi:hypothetical protein